MIGQYDAFEHGALRVTGVGQVTEHHRWVVAECAALCALSLPGSPGIQVYLEPVKMYIHDADGSLIRAMSRLDVQSSLRS